jgi:hypothetical protein
MAEPYHLAARFPSKSKAGAVYFPLQQMIFAVQNECDLSIYRIKLENVWHVIVVGERPPDNLHQRIEAALTSGVLVNLRADVLTYLLSRREEMTHIAPWVERHSDSGEDE